MIEQETGKSPEVLAAEENVRKAQEKLNNVRKKENKQKRKAQDHHKYMMGGIVVKNFRDCYLFEENELNVILAAAINTQECQEAIEEIRWQCEEEKKERESANGVGKDGADSASVGKGGDAHDGGGNGAK